MDEAGYYAAAPPPPVPRELAYHELHLAGPRGPWRPVLGVVLAVFGVFVLAPLGWLLVFTIGYAVSGQPVAEALERLQDSTNPTPAFLAYLNLVLASAIPVVWLISFALHRLTPGWLSSIAPRIRWRYFAACLGLSVIALLATLAVTAVLPSAGAGTDLEGNVNDFTTTTRDFVLVVLLLTPLQAAGEEYLFRGYLTQAFGGLFGSRVVSVVLAVLLPALLFGLAHGVQDPPIFFDRFAFGVVAGVLVIATGGLEAALAMHVLNNFLAFGLALAFADMGSALNPTGGSWWSLPGTLTQSLVYLGLALVVARRMGLRARVPEAVLVRPEARMYRSSSAP